MFGHDRCKPGDARGSVVSPDGLSEDEFVFKLDEGIDDDKIEMAKKLLNNVDVDKLSQDALDFMLMKLS